MQLIEWRCEAELNRRTRICSPLPDHSAIAPKNDNEELLLLICEQTCHHALVARLAASPLNSYSKLLSHNEFAVYQSTPGMSTPFFHFFDFCFFCHIKQDSTAHLSAYPQQNHVDYRPGQNRNQGISPPKMQNHRSKRPRPSRNLTWGSPSAIIEIPGDAVDAEHCNGCRGQHRPDISHCCRNMSVRAGKQQKRQSSQQKGQNPYCCYNRQNVGRISVHQASS